MTTRSQVGIVKPNPKYALTIIPFPIIPREPKTVRTALSHPGWKNAMLDELTTLHQNQTWKLVPRTSDMRVIGSKWVFKTKLNESEKPVSLYPPWKWLTVSALNDAGTNDYNRQFFSLAVY